MSTREQCDINLTLTTTQVDLKQDRVINVPVSVEKNAATPKSSQQVEDLHIQHSSKCTTITLSEQADKGSTELANIPTEKAQSNDADDLILVCTENNYQFKYHPVNDGWQQRVCDELHLNYIGFNQITHGGHNVTLTNPVSFRSIQGDGNCMFRAFSFIITGSEDQHLLVRSIILRHMRVVGELLWKNQISPLLQHLRRIGEVDWVRNVSPDLEWARGIEQYIAASHMDRDSTWGSEVEIMVLAHLLDIPIYSYDTNHGCNRYTPGNVYGVFDLSQFNSLQMAMYVRHDINHYDVVTSVQ